MAKDYVGSQGSAPYTLFPGTTNQQLNLAATPYELNDVSFYVLTNTGLDMVDPFTGTVEATSALPNATTVTYGDLVMRNDGELYTMTRGADTTGTDQNAAAGVLCQIDPGNPSNAFLSQQSDGLVTYELDSTKPPAGLIEAGHNDGAGGIRMEAMAYGSGNSVLYAIGNDPVPDANLTPARDARLESNLLYTLTASGTAYDYDPADTSADRAW